MTDQPVGKMFSDRESLADAIEKLHPEMPKDVIAQSVDEILEDGSGAQQVGLLSLIRILQSFIVSDTEYQGFEGFKDLSAEQVRASSTLKILKKMAAGGVTAEEITHFVRTVQFALLDDVLLALDNNVTYDEVPYSEFGVYLINTHTNEPEALIDGLHEHVESMKEEIGYENED